MKKTTTILVLGTLFIPTLLSAQTSASPALGERQARPAERQARIEGRMDARMASSTRPRNASSTKEMGFCSNIDKVLVQIDTKSAPVGEKRTEKMNSREDKREAFRQEVDTKREQNDAKRKEQLAELTRRATTEEQKAAVLTFTTAIDKALATKKTAIDSLIDSHRKEVDAIASERKASVEKALSQLKSDIEKAKTQAKNDCASGVSGETVRTTLKDAIKNAQQTFRSTVQSLNETKIKDTREVKKKELEAIEATFKKSVEDAKNALKASFKSQKATSTQSN